MLFFLQVLCKKEGLLTKYLTNNCWEFVRSVVPWSLWWKFRRELAHNDEGLCPVRFIELIGLSATGALCSCSPQDSLPSGQLVQIRKIFGVSYLTDEFFIWIHICFALRFADLCTYA